MKRIVLRRRKNIELKDPAWTGRDYAGKREDGTPWPDSAEYLEMKSACQGSERWVLAHKFRVMYGEDAGDAPEWILELALEYGAVFVGKKRRGLTMEAKEYRMYRICRALDVVAAKEATEVWKYMIYNYKGGTQAMAKTRKEDRKDKRVTASSVLVPLFSRDTVPSDEDMIESVRKATGSIKFDGRQLAWYKSQFRQGELTGQDGKKHELVSKRAKRAKSAKKVVLKKKSK